MTDFTRDFVAFWRDKCPVKGPFGPRPIVTPSLARFLRLAFPPPAGDPAARNILDSRPKKQGKSALAGAVALYMAARQDHAEVVIAAADKDQARDRVFKSAVFAVENGPLWRHAKTWRDTIEFDNGSIIQAIPNDWKGAAGGDYSAVIFDELWTSTTELERRRYDELIVPPTQPAGTRWIASYAGFEGESDLLEEVWQKAEEGERVDDELPIYHNASSSLLALIDTGPEAWRMPWTTADYIEETRRNERPVTFARLWLNEWVSSINTFVTAQQWNACYSDDVKPWAPGDDRQMTLALDASTARDSTAAVGTVKEGSDVHVVYCKVWRPMANALRDGRPTVDLEETLVKEVVRLFRLGAVQAVCGDPYQLHNIFMRLRKVGLTVREIGQTAARTEADTALLDAILAKSIKHYGHPDLDQHVVNAVGRETPRGVRLDKEKTSRKIDAAVALSMAHQEAQLHGDPLRVW